MQGPWYDSLMAAASRAITERLPLVDIIVEVRDARVPFSFCYFLLLKLAFELAFFLVSASCFLYLFKPFLLS